MKTFFEAFVYFVESGLPEKLAKELAESVTGIKAPTGKIEIPKTKSPDEFRIPEAADDVIEVSDDVSPGYAQGDTKYNADVLALGLAEKRGFIKEGQDASDMDAKKYSELYSEAYSYLTQLNFLNKPVKRTSIPKKLITKKERGNLNFIASKISNPMKSKFVLQGLDGTTESLYSTFRREGEAIKKGMIEQMNQAQKNNLAISKKDLDNIIYNLKIYKQINDKVNQLANDLIDAGKEPEKIYQNFTSNFLNRRRSGNEALEKALDEMYIKNQKMEKSVDELVKQSEDALKEIENIQSDKKKISNEIRVKNLYQGKGYGLNEALYRSLTRQFLRDEIEAGTISVNPRIYDAMKKGNHPFIDPIKVFRYHYGDDKFDVLGNYIDQFAFDMGGLKYPGRFEFRKMGLVPLNKNAPGKTYEHYSLPGEIDQQIADVDKVIKSIEDGNNPFFKTKEDIKNQNSKRANLVKIKNEITPKSKIDLTQYTNEDLNRLAEEGNILQKELAELDETGSSKIPYQEFQEKSARLDEINEIIEEAKLMPEEYFDQQPTADVVPIKQEGIIDNTALNINRNIETLNNVKLYGDETIDELKYIEENGVHPRDLDPQEGFARGGIVEVLI